MFLVTCQGLCFEHNLKGDVHLLVDMLYNDPQFRNILPWRSNKLISFSDCTKVTNFSTFMIKIISFILILTTCTSLESMYILTEL